MASIRWRNDAKWRTDDLFLETRIVLVGDSERRVTEESPAHWLESAVAVVSLCTRAEGVKIVAHTVHALS